MKKALSVILGAGLMLSLCACGATKPETSATTTATEQAAEEINMNYYGIKYGTTESGFEYNIYSEEGIQHTKIEDYTGDEENLVIPDYIEGYAVTDIDGFAFSKNPNLKSVTIPETVMTIESCAFYKCENLSEVIIPESVTLLYGDAFEGTPWLEKMRAENNPLIINNQLICGLDMAGDIVIPEGITSIAPCAFVLNEDITSVTLPESCTVIGEDAFSSCNELISVTLPETLEVLGDDAFFSCDKLETINIPESVTFIGDCAFYFCRSLEEIEIPKDFTNFGYNVFRDTKWLSDRQAENPLVILNGVLIDGTAAIGEVTIPDEVERISEFAFSDSETVTKVIFPEHITEIPSCVLIRCPNLEEVVLSDSVTTIGVNSFSDCPKLKSVTLSESLTKIDSYAFRDTPSLTEITIPNSVDINLFYNCFGSWDKEYEITAHYKGDIYTYNHESGYFESNVSSAER